MAKKICWKKGMRLTEEILTASDNCHIALVGRALIAATAGRFGLLPSIRPFRAIVSLNKNVLDVEALTCLAVTRGGDLIDIEYDTTFANPFDTRLTIPNTDEKSFYLLITASQDEWRDTNDGYCIPSYSFALIPENTALPHNALPIGHVVEEYGWRMDEVNFMPPCLYVASHPAYVNLAKDFFRILTTTEKLLQENLSSDCRTVTGIFWPVAQQTRIAMDKDIDTMTPMELFGHMQKFIGGFLCGCKMDETLDLTGERSFEEYIELPYSQKEVFVRIREGLELCQSVQEKVAKFKDFVQNVKIEAPTIARNDLIKRCTNSKVRIPIENNCPGATIYYTTDGSEPTSRSTTGDSVTLSSGFTGGRGKEEQDRIVVVKVMAMLNGASSDTNTYKITLQKDIKHWIEI